MGGMLASNGDSPKEVTVATMTRAEWVEQFTHELERLLVAGGPPAAVQLTHAGIVCGSYDVRVAVPNPHHESRVTIVATHDRMLHPQRIALPGKEFQAHLTDDPRVIALRIASWLRQRLAGNAA